MKQTFLAVGIILALSACSPESKIPPDFPELLKQTPGFEDCKIAQLQNSAGTNLYVVRCPNSSTGVSYMAGKVRMQTAVIDKN